MALRDKTIASSTPVSVNIETVMGKRTVSDNNEVPYRLSLPGVHPSVGFSLGEDGKEFFKGIQEGDQLIVIRSGNSIKAIYGPLQEGRLYQPSRRSD